MADKPFQLRITYYTRFQPDKTKKQNEKKTQTIWMFVNYCDFSYFYLNFISTKCIKTIPVVNTKE